MRRIGMAMAGLTAAATLLMTAQDAEACGGLFCDSTLPVNQAAERIIFADHPDGKVTAVVQILYEGPSEEFAWVLPVPSVPEVGVSSDLAFQRLQQATNPTYRMNTRVEGECKTVDFGDSISASANNTNGEFASPEADNGGVEVLSSGTVGPYDYTVIEVDETLDTPEQVALDWLETNGYDISQLGPNVIRPYLEDGMHLLAFRLTKNASTGSIRPVRLTYETDVPMIPIKLTAVAANEDMGVLVWVLGNSRAVPVNYKSLVLNDALIDWFNPGRNYNDVVIAAADEAGGQGFVTEFADDADTLGQVVWSSGEGGQWASIKSDLQSESVTASSAVCAVGQAYAGYDGWSETIDEFLPGLSADERDFLKAEPCRDRFAPEGEKLVPDSADKLALAELVESNIVDPMQQTQDLFTNATYATRMYTTLSAAEMTVDPLFDFNPDLGDHSQTHVAERIIECNDNYFQQDAPWRVELESGQLVRGFGNAWPISPSQVPANQMVTQDSTSGEAMVVVDNTATIRQALTEHNDEVLSQIDDGCGCATAGGRFPTELLLVALGLLGIRRRMR